jgi:hypothetical protein
MSIYTTTTNGAKALVSAGNPLVDLFFSIGALRPSIATNHTRSRKDTVDRSVAKKDAALKFANAVLFDAELASAILLWSRDLRNGGAGEREVFHTLFSTLAEADSELAKKVLDKVEVVGRFDDLEAAYGTCVQSHALDLWAAAMKNNNALAFKWADRSMKLLREHMGFKNEAEFRKYISAGRKNSTVEHLMCSKEWANISFDKLPSVAGARYANAFKKNDGARYSAFLSNKDTKVNTSALYPHDVYRTYKYGGNEEAATKLWDNMPKLDLKGNILVVADVSGSMECPASGEITCMDISIALGTYISQNTIGAFRNRLMTFSEEPSLVEIKGNTISDVFQFVSQMNWGGSTNFQKTYTQILNFATLYNVPQEQMPEFILVLSDMQFDQSDSKGTHFENMKKLFEEKGYKLPKIVFWNLNSQYKNAPVSWKNDNVCMVSGFSPSILKAIVSADLEQFNPQNIMLKAIEPFLVMLRGANQKDINATLAA